MPIGKLSLVAVLALPAFSFGLVTASPASADCAEAGGVSVCSEEGGVSMLPYYPYPCEDDWLCSTGSLSLLDPDPGGLNTDSDVSVDVGQPGSGGLNADRGGGPDRGGRDGGQ
ncbi:hypothetical protein BH11ACT7_BH11ACT7_06600 [soil metagenome]